MSLAPIHALKRILVPAIAAAIAACGSGPPLPVSLTYAPDPLVAAVPTAERVQVEVTVNDERPNKNTVGAFGVDVTPGRGFLSGVRIATNDDLTKLIRSAIQSELSNRGFELGPGNARVVVDLDGIEAKLGNDSFVNPHLMARAMVVMKVAVSSSSRNGLYSRGIDGKDISTVEKGETASSGLERALNYAIDDAVRNLMADRAFIDALLATGKPVAAVQTIPASPPPLTSP
jgi:uncharacterized lipoprotein YajG